jgi:PhnB protein
MRTLRSMTSIAPWIAVSNASEAVAFYERAFGAVVDEHLDEGDQVVVAELAIGEATFWIQDEPGVRGGGPIRIILSVDDPGAVFAQALDAGATEINPVSEGHGWLVGRLEDPFGHHWEVGRRL